MMASNAQKYDVFLSYSHEDAAWVKELAKRLEDDAKLTVWFDEWVLTPGRPFQHLMSEGIEHEAQCYTVCIGKNTPRGWVREEIQKALNRQTREPSFSVIPLLLPNANPKNVDGFLELRTWVDFRNPDFACAFHRLVCGIKGIPPGRGPCK